MCLYILRKINKNKKLMKFSYLFELIFQLFKSNNY